jgi:hypothetical protein
VCCDPKARALKVLPISPTERKGALYTHTEAKNFCSHDFGWDISSSSSKKIRRRGGGGGGYK